MIYFLLTVLHRDTSILNNYIILEIYFYNKSINDARYDEK